MKEKRNIFLVGPMGAGKSTIGRKLAKQLNMNFFDSDTEIEKKTGVNVSWIFDMEGENGFRKREEETINKLTKLKEIVLATGGGSIKSNKIRNYLSDRGLVIYLKINIENQLNRVRYNKKRPLLKNHINIKEILQKLATERNHLYEKISDITIQNNEKNINIIVNKIIDTLPKNNNLI